MISTELEKEIKNFLEGIIQAEELGQWTVLKSQELLKKMSHTYLTCHFSEGQFTDEKAVWSEDVNGHGFSFFIETNQGIIKDKTFLVPVKILDQKDNKVLIQLPTPIIGSNRTVTVNKSLITVE